MNCRHCNTYLSYLWLDLGVAPLSNSFLNKSDLNAAEKFFPLKVYVCHHCWLVQTQDYSKAEEIFSSTYAYFSSYSAFWLEHARIYVEHMTNLLRLGHQSFVVEVAANDGYLLQNFVEKGIPCLGIEPTQSTADVAKKKNIPIEQDFFGLELAKKIAIQKGLADLLIANNVLAHVPNINDFVQGFSLLLKPTGTVTFEFPHLVELVKGCYFDTVYHEHFSYLSLTAVISILERNGLSVYDVEKIPTHGGSLRVFAQKNDIKNKRRCLGVDKIIQEENLLGLKTIQYYCEFQSQVEKIKNKFISFLIDAKSKGKKTVGYGAAAKASTLLNFSGVKKDLVSYISDKNPNKQEKYMPGCRIPIASEDEIRKDRPDYVIIFVWNLCQEVMSQLSYIEEWGGKFVCFTPNPHLSESLRKKLYDSL